jgi:small-conductance mechanosensitive channel
VFVVRASVAGIDAATRAKKAEAALRGAFDEARDGEAEVRVERSGEVAVVYVGRTPIIQLTSTDAEANGEGSLDAHAATIAAQIEVAIEREKARNALARRIFGISMVVLFGVIVIYLLRKAGEITERANHWLDDNPQRVPAMRVRTLTLLTPAAVRSGSALALGVGKWVFQFTIVYLWLVAALNQFTSTRGYTERINRLILEPFVALTTRVVSTLPVAVVVAIAGLVLLLVLRVVGLFFRAVRDGTTTVGWLPADLAEPTRLLVRVGIVLVTLVFAAPVLTGHDDGALARAGLLGLVTLGLASTPVVANVVLGMWVTFGRRFRVGDRLAIGDASGQLVAITLFELTLRSGSGTLRVPHLVSLWRTVALESSRERRVRCSVPLESATLAFERRVLTRLREELLEVDATILPSLEIEELTATAATYAVVLESPADFEVAPSVLRAAVLRVVNQVRCEPRSEGGDV